MNHPKCLRLRMGHSSNQNPSARDPRPNSRMHCTRHHHPIYPHRLPSFASLRPSHPICMLPPFIPCVTHQPSTWLMSCNQPDRHSENSFFVPVLPHSSSRSSAQASHMGRLSRVKCHDEAALHKSISCTHRRSPKNPRTICQDSLCFSPRSYFTNIVGLYITVYCCLNEKYWAFHNGPQLILPFFVLASSRPYPPNTESYMSKPLHQSPKQNSASWRTSQHVHEIETEVFDVPNHRNYRNCR